MGAATARVRERPPTRALLVALGAACMAYALAQSLVVPALPEVAEHLGASQNATSWVFTAYLLSASVCTPIVGRLGDMYGRRRMLLLSLGALAVGAAIAAFTTSLAVMIGARAIQGIGGGVLPLSFALVRDEVPTARVPGAVGMLGGLGAAGSGVGLVLCGPIDDLLGYEWLFLSCTVFSALAAVAAYLVVTESEPAESGRIGWLAPLLLSSWLVALLLGISQAPDWGWTSPRALGLIIVAVALIPVWIRVESRSALPLIDMKMMRLTGVWTSNLIALLFGVGLYAGFVFLPPFLQSPESTGYGFGSSITQSGLALLPFTVMSFLTGMTIGRIQARMGPRGVLAGGALITAVSYLVLLVAHDEFWQILVSMTLMGMGSGILFAALSTAVVRAVPREQTGVATGMNANIRTIGGAFGAAVVSTVITASAPEGSAFPTEAGYEKCFLVLALIMLVAAAATALIPKPRRPEAEPESPPLAYVELGLTPASPDGP